MAFDDHVGGLVPFEAPHRAKPGLEAPMVSFDPVVGVLRGVVKRDRKELGDRAWARSVVISAGSPWERIALAKNAVAAFRSRFLDKNTSMTCPYWSTAR